MGILSKHLNLGEPIKIGEDEIKLKALGTEHIPDFFQAMKTFSGAKEGASTEDMLKNIDDDGLSAIQRLIDKTMEISLPDEPEEDRKAFGLKYMMVLLPKIMEINMQQEKEVGKMKKIDALKKLQQKRQEEADKKE